MSQSIDHPSESPARTRAVAWRALQVAGAIALLAWAAWWIYSLDTLDLLGCASTWIRYPFLGADFTTQSDYAARLWAGGVDPYEFRDHLFHYPPLVIRLFLWTPFFSNATALRIWIVVLGALIALGTVVAVLVRKQLGLERVPMALAVALVLFSFPAVFTMERANFDLLTLAALLIAFWLFERGGSKAEFLAGCILAVGPWVKLYPGIMGLGLLATRRFRAVAGFVVAGAAIGLAAPSETLRSFEVLRIEIERIKAVSKTDPLPTWSHSLSVAWQQLTQAMVGTAPGKLLALVPPDLAAGGLVFALAAWVCLHVFRSRGAEKLIYPLLLWLNAVGSCVGALANDYSLMFLPLAIVAVCSLRDPWFVKVSLALLVIWWQPFDLPIPAAPLLMIKVLALIAVAVSLVRRARELTEARATLTSSEASAQREPLPLDAGAVRS